jgi:hypothetical protein
MLSVPLLLIVNTFVDAFQTTLLQPAQVSRGVPELFFMFVMRMLSLDARGPLRSTGCRSSGSVREPRV